MKLGLVSDGLGDRSFWGLLDQAVGRGVDRVEVNTGGWSTAASRVALLNQEKARGAGAQRRPCPARRRAPARVPIGRAAGRRGTRRAAGRRRMGRAFV